jgi:hypothetical protein
MAKSAEVLAYLRPDGGYVQVGHEYEGITFEPQCEPFTKAEYEAAFEIVDQLKIEQVNQASIKREGAIAKLQALGLDEDDLKALGL